MDEARYLVDKAGAFAHAAHGAIRQKRKYTGDDYIVHPAAVASLCATYTDSPIIIAAAWLHDVIEDCNITFGLLQHHFGSDVARIVLECSDMQTAADGNRETRKARALAYACDISPEAKTVKLADLIDNTVDITRHDPKFAKVYMPEKRRLLHALAGGQTDLWVRAAKQVEAYFAPPAPPNYAPKAPVAANDSNPLEGAPAELTFPGGNVLRGHFKRRT